MLEATHMVTKEQLESFYAFATSQIGIGKAELSLDEIYGWWRAKHLLPSELAESVTALRASFAELEAGHRGRSARLAVRESCQRLGLVLDE